ncbi:MAG: hypothetical protein K6T83_06735 [Alicyclobacillus sp.]|nr:hypothetical protein [Alicyclobacillus sp.]
MEFWTVWVLESDGWWLVGHVSKDEANEIARKCNNRGMQFRIHPKHTNTDKDLVEG